MKLIYLSTRSFESLLIEKIRKVVIYLLFAYRNGGEDMKRVVINFIIFLFAAIGTFFIKNLLIEGHTIMRIVGRVGLVISIVYLIFEKKMNLPTIYGRSQSGGSNANGAALLGLSCGLISIGVVQLIVGLVLGAVVIVLVNRFVTVETQ